MASRRLPACWDELHPRVAAELETAVSKLDDGMVAVSAGATGPAGPEGPQGPIGPQGEIGPAGPQGPKGDKGDTGSQGPQGLTGDTGPAGADGAAGAQGAEGPQGPQGPAGQDGAAGAQGPKGDQGDIGPQGPQGEIGPQGPQGEVGPQGPAGQDGAGGPAFPVGSVFVSVVATDPSVLLGYGTWAAIGAGRVPVGFDGNDTDFDTLKETGGAKTHTLTEAQIPSHTHAVTDPGHTHLQQRLPTATGGVASFTVDTSMSGTPAAANATGSATTGITLGNTGGGAAHNNVQPYFVVRFWERTA